MIASSVSRELPFELVGDDGGDALVGQCADRDRAGRDQLGAFGINILEQPQHAETGPEFLFGMRPIGQDGEDEPLGVGPHPPPPAPEIFIGSSLGVTPMRTGHVIGISAVPAAAITALVSSNTQTPMEQLDGPSRVRTSTCARISVAAPVVKAIDLDVIIEPDAGEAPFRELLVGIRERLEDARSTLSNNCRRPTPIRRMGRSLMRSSAALIAALPPPSEKKVWLRRRPRM